MSDNDAMVISGPAGDRIEISRAEFSESHYKDQGYEEAEALPEPVPEPTPEPMTTPVPGV